jgi:transposase InsO family protein
MARPASTSRLDRSTEAPALHFAPCNTSSIEGCCEDQLNPPTRESVELATLEWVVWFNHHRLMEPLGYIPPTEAETNYYRQLEIVAAESAST